MRKQTVAAIAAGLKSPFEDELSVSAAQTDGYTPALEVQDICNVLPTIAGLQSHFNADSVIASIPDSPVQDVHTIRTLQGINLLVAATPNGLYACCPASQDAATVTPVDLTPALVETPITQAIVLIIEQQTYMQSGVTPSGFTPAYDARAAAVAFLYDYIQPQLEAWPEAKLAFSVRVFGVATYPLKFDELNFDSLAISDLTAIDDFIQLSRTVLNDGGISAVVDATGDWLNRAELTDYQADIFLFTGGLETASDEGVDAAEAAFDSLAAAFIHAIYFDVAAVTTIPPRVDRLSDADGDTQAIYAVDSAEDLDTFFDVVLPTEMIEEEAEPHLLARTTYELISANAGFAWEKIAFAPTGSPNPWAMWTWAILKNRVFYYQQGLGYIAEIVGESLTKFRVDQLNPYGIIGSYNLYRWTLDVALDSRCGCTEATIEFSPFGVPTTIFGLDKAHTVLTADNQMQLFLGGLMGTGGGITGLAEDYTPAEVEVQFALGETRTVSFLAITHNSAPSELTVDFDEETQLLLLGGFREANSPFTRVKVQYATSDQPTDIVTVYLAITEQMDSNDIILAITDLFAAAFGNPGEVTVTIIQAAFATIAFTATLVFADFTAQEPTLTAELVGCTGDYSGGFIGDPLATEARRLTKNPDGSFTWAGIESGDLTGAYAAPEVVGTVEPVGSTLDFEMVVTEVAEYAWADYGLSAIVEYTDGETWSYWFYDISTGEWSDTVNSNGPAVPGTYATSMPLVAGLAIKNVKFSALFSTLSPLRERAFELSYLRSGAYTGITRGSLDCWTAWDSTPEITLTANGWEWTGNYGGCDGCGIGLELIEPVTVTEETPISITFEVFGEASAFDHLAHPVNYGVTKYYNSTTGLFQDEYVTGFAPPAGIYTVTSTLPAAATLTELSIWMEDRPTTITAISFPTCTACSITIGNGGEPEIVDTPLAAMVGITTGKSRLMAWDQENAIYRSAILDPLDFVPAIATQASIGKVAAVRGNIVMMAPYVEGFLIYSTDNVVRAEYEATDFVFKYKELPSNGIADPRHLAYSPYTHVFFNINGLHKYVPTADAISSLSPQLDHWLIKYPWPLKLSYLGDRYIVVYLPEPMYTEQQVRRRRDYAAIQAEYLPVSALPAMPLNSVDYHTHKRALLFDETLKQLGSCDMEHWVLFSMQPLNASGLAIDRSVQVAVGAGGHALGGVIPDVGTVLFTPNSDTAFVALGHLLRSPTGLTTFLESYAEFVNGPTNALAATVSWELFNAENVLQRTIDFSLTPGKLAERQYSLATDRYADFIIAGAFTLKSFVVATTRAGEI